MEHVGYKNYADYMQVVDRCLKEDGIAFMHTIGGNDSITTGEPWTDKYIFPNGMLPFHCPAWAAPWKAVSSWKTGTISVPIMTRP